MEEVYRQVIHVGGEPAYGEDNGDGGDDHGDSLPLLHAEQPLQT